MTHQDVKPVRYGMIGFGGIAENRLAKEGFSLDETRFSPDRRVLLNGVTDINPKRRKAAEDLGIRWYGSGEELLASRDIEAIFVTSSNSAHFELARKALLVGKHVLVEKPIATSVEDARILVNLAAERKRSLMVDHMMVHNQLNRKSRDIIRSGELGKVHHITLHMEFLFGATAEEAASWRCSVPSELGGPLGDVGSHCLYMAEFLLDERITSLRCVYTPRTLDLNVENGGIIEFTLASGRTGTARVAFNQDRGALESTLQNLGYEVYGEKGSLHNSGSLFQLSGHGDEPIQQRLEWRKDGEVQNFFMNSPQNIYQAQIHAHAESIRSGEVLDGEEAVHNLQMILAAHESATEKGALRHCP